MNNKVELKPIGTDDKTSSETTCWSKLCDLENGLDFKMTEFIRKMNEEIDAFQKKVDRLAIRLSNASSGEGSIESYISGHLLHLSMRLASLSSELHHRSHNRDTRSFVKTLIRSCEDEFKFIMKAVDGLELPEEKE